MQVAFYARHEDGQQIPLHAGEQRLAFGVAEAAVEFQDFEFIAPAP